MPVMKLARGGHVSAVVMDLTGRLVRQLHDGDLAAGYHGLTWDGTDARGQGLASGVYFVRLVADGQVRTRKMTLLK